MDDELLYEISLWDILSGKIAEAEGHVAAFEEALAKTTGLINDLTEAVEKLREASEGVEVETTGASVSTGASQDADSGKQASEGANTLVAELTLLKKAIDDIKESIGNLVTEEKADFISATKELSAYFSALNGLLNDNKAAFVADDKAVANDTVALREHAKVSAAVAETASGWEKLKKVVENVKTILDGYKDVKGLAELFSGGKNAEKTVTNGTAQWFGKAAVALAGADIILSLGAKDKLTGKGIGIKEYLEDWGGLKTYLSFGMLESNPQRIEKRNEQLDNLEHSLNSQGNRLSGNDYIYNNTVSRGKLKSSGTDLLDMISKSPLFDEIDNFDDYGERLYQTNAELLPVLKQIWSDLPFILEKDEIAGGSRDSDESDQKVGNINPYFPNLPSQKQSDIKASRQLQQNQLNVQGRPEKKITININGGLVHNFTVQSGSLKESVPDIKRIVEGAIMDALKDAEIQN